MLCISSRARFIALAPRLNIIIGIRYTAHIVGASPATMGLFVIIRITERPLRHDLFIVGRNFTECRVNLLSIVSRARTALTFLSSGVNKRSESPKIDEYTREEGAYRSIRFLAERASGSERLLKSQCKCVALLWQTRFGTAANARLDKQTLLSSIHIGANRCQMLRREFSPNYHFCGSARTVLPVLSARTSVNLRKKWPPRTTNVEFSSVFSICTRARLLLVAEKTPEIRVGNGFDGAATARSRDSTRQIASDVT